MDALTPSTFEIGRLRHQVRLQRFVPTDRSSTGAPVGDWEDVATLFAAVTPGSGKELFAAAQIYPEANTQISIRYMPGIDASMRVLWNDPITHEDRQFDIQQVLDLNEAHVEIALVCIERPINRNP